jgi:hypothetical protein
MINETKPEKAEMRIPSQEEIIKGIEIHKEAAKHHEEAAKQHREAVMHLEAGEHERALECTIKAQEHQAKATEFHKEVLRVHYLRG